MFNRPISRSLILTILCGLAVTPFFFWGSPSGHDFEFHLSSWMEVLAQWKQGVVYPRWAALAHSGYGEARFIFYPPASWTLGAALGAILPWKLVPGAFCWIVLTASGASMYRLARQWLCPGDALFAAAFYALNPYHLIIVYWRSAYAELLVAVFLPLMLLCLLRLNEPGLRSTLGLSLTLASSWLTNIPAAVMIHYSVAGLAVLIATQRRSARLLIKTAVAVLLGAGLASIFLVPAIYEQSWVNISQVLSPGVRPEDNFLFTFSADPDHNRFNLLVSFLALAEIGGLALAIINSRGTLKGMDVTTPTPNTMVTSLSGQFDRRTWLLLSAWGVASAFVMLSASNLLWEHLPKFRFVQLPFRWLLCMNVPLALLLALPVRGHLFLRSASPRLSAPTCSTAEWARRALVCAALLAVLLIGGHRIQPPWWELSADIQQMSDAVADGSGYEGTDEYVPVAADPYEVKTELPKVSDMSGAPVRVQIREWQATRRYFIADADSSQNLTVRLFNYPAWRLVLNGKPTPTQTTQVTGLMIVLIAAGTNDVRIDFTRTADRLIGALTSLLSIVVFVVLWRVAQVRNRRKGTNPDLPAAERYHP